MTPRVLFAPTNKCSGGVVRDWFGILLIVSCEPWAKLTACTRMGGSRWPRLLASEPWIWGLLWVGHRGGIHTSDCKKSNNCKTLLILQQWRRTHLATPTHLHQVLTLLSFKKKFGWGRGKQEGGSAQAWPTIKSYNWYLSLCWSPSLLFLSCIVSFQGTIRSEIRKSEGGLYPRYDQNANQTLTIKDGREWRTFSLTARPIINIPSTLNTYPTKFFFVWTLNCPAKPGYENIGNTERLR